MGKSNGLEFVMSEREVYEAVQGHRGCHENNSSQAGGPGFFLCDFEKDFTFLGFGLLSTSS